jgi:hypothetical protein
MQSGIAEVADRPHSVGQNGAAGPVDNSTRAGLKTG